jgi:hypothetical protein
VSRVTQEMLDHLNALGPLPSRPKEGAQSSPSVDPANAVRHPPTALPPSHVHVSELGKRVVRALSSMREYWLGDPYEGGQTTGSIASILGIVARTSERDALNAELTFLRKHDVIHFEFNSETDAEGRWWLK